MFSISIVSLQTKLNHGQGGFSFNLYGEFRLIFMIKTINLPQRLIKGTHYFIYNPIFRTTFIYFLQKIILSVLPNQSDTSK